MKNNNTPQHLYILNHPYVLNDEIFSHKKGVRLFCEMRHMNYDEFIEGKNIDGWTLTVI